MSLMNSGNSNGDIYSLVPDMQSNEQNGYRVWAQNLLEEEKHPAWHAFDGKYLYGNDMSIEYPYDQTTYIYAKQGSNIIVFVELPTPKTLLMVTAVPVYFGGDHGWTYPTGITVYGSNDGEDFSQKLFASVLGYCYAFTTKEEAEKFGKFKYFKIVFNSFSSRGAAIADIKLFGM